MRRNATLVFMLVKLALITILVQPATQDLPDRYANTTVAHVMASCVIDIRVNADSSVPQISILMSARLNAIRVLIYVPVVHHRRLVKAVYQDSGVLHVKINAT